MTSVNVNPKSDLERIADAVELLSGSEGSATPVDSSVVTFTISYDSENEVLVSSKTYAELVSAITAGKFVVGEIYIDDINATVRSYAIGYRAEYSYITVYYSYLYQAALHLIYFSIEEDDGSTVIAYSGQDYELSTGQGGGSEETEK